MCKSQYILVKIYIYAIKFVNGILDEFGSIFCWKFSCKKLSMKFKYLDSFKGKLQLNFIVSGCYNILL
jgi:hypothetical protein